eukprot:scaffold82577_cov18-Tisochrysis_lutea.AAC.2
MSLICAGRRFQVPNTSNTDCHDTVRCFLRSQGYQVDDTAQVGWEWSGGCKKEKECKLPFPLFLLHRANYPSALLPQLFYIDGMEPTPVPPTACLMPNRVYTMDIKERGPGAKACHHHGTISQAQDGRIS